MQTVKTIATALLLIVAGFIVGVRYGEISNDLQTGTPTVYEEVVPAKVETPQVSAEKVKTPKDTAKIMKPTPTPTLEPIPEPEPEVQIWREDVPMSAELQDALLRVCDSTGVDPLLALGLIETESNFKPDAVSQWGDYGLCQLNCLYFPVNVTPEENIQMGMELLASNIQKYGTIEAALTAYNRGHDDGTRFYASEVLKNAAKWGYQQ